MQAGGRAADEVGSARPRAFVQVGPALAVGVLPRATPGLAAALGVAWPRLRVALGYAGWFRSPARWAEDRQIGADVALHAGSLRVGPVRRVGPVELQAALGLEFGRCARRGSAARSTSSAGRGGARRWSAAGWPGPRGRCGVMGRCWSRPSW
ncbi:hypothetical protein [Nannocystis pusilla]|uniref:hypothetical protein n=1 Tax=Nannocystis pusilla TaxID=889268 RepID=UPI003B7DFDC7